MKKQKTLLALVILITSLSFGQTNALNTTGNVGIGITTPESKLHLNGSFSSTNSKGILAIESPDVYSSLYFGINNISPYMPFLQSATRQNNNPYDLLINPRGGNVGIGTTSPTNALTVQKVSGGVGVSGTDGTGGVRVNWSSGYGVALDAWDGNEPRWGITSFSGNTPTVILEGKYSSKDAYFNSGGNVGIGTTTPAALLDLQKLYGNDVGIKLSQPGSSIWDIKNTASTGLFTIGAGGGTYFNINHQTGNVGIGTTTPIYKLDTGILAFDTADGGSIRFGQGERDAVGDKYPTSIKAFFKAPNPVDLGLNFYVANANTNGATEMDRKKLVATMLGNGNVGIGTTTPDKKLTVNGTIHSSEVIVDTNFTPDYVFQKYYTGKSDLKSDYIMPTLAEIESFTKKNHHLPNVPSAQEIKQNGLSLGEMSNVLLQKVEELTLYAIEQQKEIDRLKKENENYRSLAERLSSIEKVLKN